MQVQSGDTVWNFAQQYNSTVDAIAQRNQLADPNFIQVGQQLIIPDSATSAVSQVTGDTAAVADNTAAASATSTVASVSSASLTSTVAASDATAASDSSVSPLSANSINLTSGSTSSVDLDLATPLSATITSNLAAATATNTTSAATSQTSYEANSAAALQSMSSYAISYGTVEETAASYNTTDQSSAQPAQTATNSASDTTSANTSSAVATAKSMIGVPYVWGGNTPSGFDCSGLVQYSYNLGSDYRTTYQQTNLGQHKYDVENAQSGDLYFWGTESAPYHVAIAEGNGNYIQAPTPGQNVQEGNIQYYRPNFYISMNQ
ncbi:NlpC/P60 family protein [Limosilactobacillus sp.]|uniref:NlpC/P60 family protein n=1 Tax=Limosilactobacillus sp. TaxID=2773925 RepID=UPI003F0A508A